MNMETIDLSTVDQNGSLDGSYAGDGGASDLSSIAGTIGQWGSVIGSIVTNRPVTVAQTSTGQIVPLGAQGSRIVSQSPAMSALPMLLLVVAGLGAGWVIFKKA